MPNEDPADEGGTAIRVSPSRRGRPVNGVRRLPSSSQVGRPAAAGYSTTLGTFGARGHAACPRSRARASRGRPGRGRPRSHADAARARSCARRRRAGCRCKQPRSRPGARGRRARGGTASGTSARSACSRTHPTCGRSARPRRPHSAPPHRRSPSPGRVELRREIDARSRCASVGSRSSLPHSSRVVRSRRRSRSGSLRKSSSTILPFLTVTAAIENTSPRRKATIPATPLTSTGRASPAPPRA